MKVNQFIFVILLISTVSLCIKNKKVNAVLKAKWPAYPLASESSEFFAQLSNNDFWRYFEAVSVIPQGTEREVYDYLLKKGLEVNLTDAKLSYLKWSLSIHNENPKLEMYRHLVDQHLNLEERKKLEDTCLNWIFANGHILCTVTEINQNLQKIINENTGIEQPQIYSFDHVHPSSPKETSIVVILYGMFGEADTMEFHKILTNLLESGNKFTYIFRHYFSPMKYNNFPKLNLQGFGIDLALKSLEYKVIDDTKHETEGNTLAEEEPQGDAELPVQGFDFKLLTKNYPESTSELLTFKAHLLSEELDLEKLKVWELKDLGLISAQKILEAPDPLLMLRDISQNLPILAHSLARQGINSTARSNIITTIDQLQEKGMSRNLVWINTTPFDPSNINIYQLYSILSKQVINYDLLKSLHIKSEDIYKILTLPFSESSEIQINLHTELTDFVNDLETDTRYQSWHKRVRDILLPVWPGQFHYVQKNFFTIIIVIDPASRDSIAMAQRLSSLIWQNLPARVGFLFDLRDDISEIGLRIWRYIKLSFGVTRWFQYLSQLLNMSQSPRFTEDDLEKAVIETIGNYYQEAKESVENEIDDYILKTKEYITEKGISGLSPIIFINGYLTEVQSVDTMIEPLVTKIFQLRSQLQEFVQNDEITDDTDIYSFLSSREDTLLSFNRLILPSPNEKLKYIGLFDSLVDEIGYLNAIEADDLIQPITHLLTVNMNTQQGRLLVTNAIDRLTENAEKVRVGLIDCVNSIILRAINTILYTRALSKDYLPLVQQLLSLDENAISEDTILQLVKESNIKFTKFNTIFSNISYWKDLEIKQKDFCKNTVGLLPEQSAIITGGRLIVLPSDTTFSISDFKVLETYEYTSRLSLLQISLQDISYEVDPDFITSSFISGILQKIASILALIPDRATSQIDPPLIEPSFTVKSGNLSHLSIVTILDPLSSAAQKLTPILISFLELFDCTISVILNPSRSLSDMPIKNFYRYQMDVISFDENGRSIPGGIATFTNLPQGRLLSMTVTVPPSWLVLSSKCIYDLDNIVLENLPSDEIALNAEFSLENILLEGSCMDMSNRGVPPRGLELILGDKNTPHIQDSLVMSNLGYFQLKANPGIWNLALAPGRANTIYQIRDHSIQTIFMNDFLGEKQILYVEKRQGMEKVSLFDELGEQQQKKKQEEKRLEFWDTFSGLFGRDPLKPSKISQEPTSINDETIHVFSLASGHLYERFLKIMMLSVIKHTKSPVKFWLLSNFLSPAFKEFVPKMAEKYGFEVELVTYKWPVWLHEQTEKQRIIWGYKILFLDVLFPLSLKRVIYVDADQVVYTDLKELRDMDLNGAPYGYTPFCSGQVMNTATTGFRFWDSGYWRDHLGGKSYHISALYVIDLHTLRERGYSDQLRATYDGLSRDPNSLANLDQDLPNYLQHMVPIYSLPQEWLWCETWCTMESKKFAKTIDLCNNPLTKIPKLDAAVKLIPEWTDYDTEIKLLETQLPQKSPNNNTKKEDLK